MQSERAKIEVFDSLSSVSRAGLYIHVPFCKRKCAYCDFYSAPCDEATMRAYADKLIDQIVEMGDACHAVIDTIYVGGGTPSALPKGEISRIARAVKGSFDTDVVEFTVECNPESTTADKLDELSEAGVTRVSMGVQSTRDDTLRTLGRIHTFDRAREAAKLASLRFDLNVDLMLGVPNQDESDLAAFADFASESGAVHVSAYTLTLESGTPLYNSVQNKQLIVPSDDKTADLYWFFDGEMARRGYQSYETSNYAKVGKECKHNLKYWRMDDYIALGVSAHGKHGSLRYDVCADTAQFIASGARYEIEEHMSLRDMLDEYVMLGLRLSEGVDVAKGVERFGLDARKIYEAGIAKYRDYLDLDCGAIAIKPRYRLLANSVIAGVLYS